jgi:hypothetical protein
MEQLLELERLLAEQGAPAVEHFRPPATAADLIRVESYLRTPLPEEVKLWWSWHDGVEAEPGAGRCSIGPFFYFCGSGEAIGATREAREILLDADPETLMARRGTLGLTPLSLVACSCVVAADAPVPILDFDPRLADQMGTLAARSFGEMVGWWIEALESQAWRYGHNRGRWDRVADLISIEREATGLV